MLVIFKNVFFCDAQVVYTCVFAISGFKRNENDKMCSHRLCHSYGETLKNIDILRDLSTIRSTTYNEKRNDNFFFCQTNSCTYTYKPRESDGNTSSVKKIIILSYTKLNDSYRALESYK